MEFVLISKGGNWLPSQFEPHDIVRPRESGLFVGVRWKLKKSRFFGHIAFGDSQKMFLAKRQTTSGDQSFVIIRRNFFSGPLSAKPPNSESISESRRRQWNQLAIRDYAPDSK